MLYPQNPLYVINNIDHIRRGNNGTNNSYICSSGSCFILPAKIESGEGVSFGICDCGRGCAYDAGFDNKSKARTKCRKE